MWLSDYPEVLPSTTADPTTPRRSPGSGAQAGAATDAQDALVFAVAAELLQAHDETGISLRLDGTETPGRTTHRRTDHRERGLSRGARFSGSSCSRRSTERRAPAVTRCSSSSSRPR